MLELTDPLWAKLDDAHRDRDIPEWLSGLAASWEDDEASVLFWDYLCHQDTCYGATYAAVPYLLEIANPDDHGHQRREIAIFLGAVVACAFDRRTTKSDALEETSLQGLPQTLDGWNRKLDAHRSLVELLEEPDRTISSYEQEHLLPHSRAVLARASVDETDLIKIQAIRRDFLTALPQIRALCARAYLENLRDGDASNHLLSGVAAAEGLIDLAHLLEGGAESGFNCSFCGWGYESQQFGERVAFYADERPPDETYSRVPESDRALLDYKDGLPSRADGFLSPVPGAEDLQDERAAGLLDLAMKSDDPRLPLLMRNYLGRFVCAKCGKEGPLAVT